MKENLWFQSIKETDPFARACNRGAGWMFGAIGLICFAGWLMSSCQSGGAGWLLHAEQVPDYRNGKPNALVCSNEGHCIQCDHEIAQTYARLYRKGRWDGSIVFLPLNKTP